VQKDKLFLLCLVFASYMLYVITKPFAWYQCNTCVSKPKKKYTVICTAEKDVA